MSTVLLLIVDPGVTNQDITLHTDTYKPIQMIPKEYTVKLGNFAFISIKVVL